MKFNEFAASFRNPEEKIPWSGAQFQGPSGDVIIAGTVLQTEHAFCIVDINGTQYEIPAVDVSDIKIFPPTSRNGISEEPSKSTAQKKGAAAKEEKEEAEISTGPQFALINVNRNAVLCRRVPMQAAAVAAAGTWVSIAPPASSSVASPPTKP